jgi:hypothetical protein
MTFCTTVWADTRPSPTSTYSAVTSVRCRSLTIVGSASPPLPVQVLTAEVTPTEVVPSQG